MYNSFFSLIMPGEFNGGVLTSRAFPYQLRLADHTSDRRRRQMSVGETTGRGQGFLPVPRASFLQTANTNNPRARPESRRKRDDTVGCNWPADRSRPAPSAVAHRAWRRFGLSSRRARKLVLQFASSTCDSRAGIKQQPTLAPIRIRQ